MSDGFKMDKFVIERGGFVVEGTLEGGWVVHLPADQRDYGRISTPIRAFSAFRELIVWLAEHDPERRWLPTERGGGINSIMESAVTSILDEQEDGDA